jgi:spermidine/putrescine transport system permease protein
MRSLNQTHPLVAGTGWLCLFLLYAPLLAIVIVSFIPAWIAPNHDLPFYGAYERMLNDQVLLEPLLRSFLIAVGSSTVSTLLGALAALGLQRGKFPGRQWLDSLILSPLVFPEIVFGITSLIWFLILRISLGNVSILLAHITFTISYAVVTVRARLQNFDETLEEAARDLGATTFQVFRHVTIPLLWPGILGAWLMGFAISFDDFLVTFFVAGVGTDTLPVKLYSMIKFGLNPSLYALSATVLLITALPIVIGAWLNRKSAV